MAENLNWLSRNVLFVQHRKSVLKDASEGCVDEGRLAPRTFSWTWSVAALSARRPKLRAATDEELEEPEVQSQVEESAREQQRAKISETLNEHGLTATITHVLNYAGFVCGSSTGDADGGMDNVAVHGRLGLNRLFPHDGGRVRRADARPVLVLWSARRVKAKLLSKTSSCPGGPCHASQSLQRERFSPYFRRAEDVVDSASRGTQVCPRRCRRNCRCGGHAGRLELRVRL